MQITPGGVQCIMMKELNGAELAEFIMERQGHAVRVLRQSEKIVPRLAIVRANDDPVTDVYMRLKTRYGSEIQVEVDVHDVAQAKAAQLIKDLNKDKTVHGIIVQLPLKDPAQTDELVNMVKPAKDVDALGAKAAFDPATPTAILWLLAGYNIELKGKHIVLVGRGRLVGAPLEKMLQSMGHDVVVADINTTNLAEMVLAADIVITAVGSPGLITSDMLKREAVVVDAGVASEGGKLRGDLDPAVYERDDLKITPVKGGVGPLTVCALFENVIKAARATIAPKAA